MNLLRSNNAKAARRFISAIALAAVVLAAISFTARPAHAAAVGTYLPGVMQCENPSGLDFAKRVIALGPRVKAGNVSTRVDYQWFAWRARPVSANLWGERYYGDWTPFTYAYAADTTFTGAYFYDFAFRSPLAGNGFLWDLAENMAHYVQNELRYYDGSKWSLPATHWAVDVNGSATHC